MRPDHQGIFKAKEFRLYRVGAELGMRVSDREETRIFFP